MLATTGSFDAAGTPTVEILVGGTFSTNPVKFKAIIDTGFTGFLSMPMIQAFPLGLPLTGTTSVVLADGENHSKLLATATVKFLDIEERGLVILENSSNDVLIGMDFIRTFKLVTMISGANVSLIKESDLAEGFEEMRARHAKATPEGSSEPRPPMAVGTNGPFE